MSILTIHRHGTIEEDGSFTGTSLEVGFKGEDQLPWLAFYILYWQAGVVVFGKMKTIINEKE